MALFKSAIPAVEPTIVIICKPQRSLSGDESGFTLVEAVVALAVLTIIMTALAYSAAGSVRASYASRLEQQGIDFGTQQLEKLRELDFAALGNVAGQVAADPMVNTCSGGYCIDPGTGTAEKIITTGGISPYSFTADSQTANKTTFTLKTFVTVPADKTPAEYKRVTVITSWNFAGLARSRTISSIIALTQRGLPLPMFKLTPIGTPATAVNPGAPVVFGFSLTNQGAPDRWNISSSGWGSWQFIKDNGDGVYDSAVDITPLTDSSADGIVDTGRIDPTGQIFFWAVATVPTGTSAASYTAALKAASVSQPTAVTANATADMRVNVVIGTVTVTPTPSAPSASTTATPTPSGTSTPTATASPSPTSSSTTTAGYVPPAKCYLASPASATANTGYTKRAYVLHNRVPASTTVTVGDTSTSALGLPLVTIVNASPAVGANVDLPDYSTDVGPGVQGRTMLAGGSFATTDTKKVVAWRANVDKGRFSGTAVLTIWINAVNSTSNLGITAQLGKEKNGWTALGSAVAATIPTYTCGGWAQVQFNLPINVTGALQNNQYIGVKLWNSGANQIRIAYDSVEFPSTLELPEARP